MLIKVTEKHIRNGTREDCNNCAIALALKDAGFKDVTVSDSNNIVCDLESYRAYDCEMISSDINSWIDSFDAGYPVNPIEFEIEPKNLNYDPTPDSRPVE